MPLRLVTLAVDVEREAGLATTIGARRDLDLVMRCVDRIELLGTIRGGDLDGVVCVGVPAWLDPMASQEARDGGVVLIGITGDPLEADRLAMLGAKLLPAAATVDDIVAVLEEGRTGPTPAIRHSSDPEPSRNGRVTAVWGPKGAPGRSTLAIELAWQMSWNEEVALVDADPYGGDILQMTGIVEEIPSIVWAASTAAAGNLTATSFTALRRTSEPGPVVLPGLSRPELWADVSDFGWEAAISALRKAFDRVVCDVGFSLEPPDVSIGGAPRGRNEMTRIALRRAHHVVAVCRGDAVGVKNFLWAYGSLTELVDAEDVAIVVNRIKAADVPEIGAVMKRYIGRRPIAFITEDSKEVDRARNEGRAVAERSPRCDLAAATANLAAALGGRPAQTGLLTRLAGRR